MKPTTMAIHKYPIDVADVQDIDLPSRAKILSFQIQYDVPCIWALVDIEAPMKPRRLHLVGTGHRREEDFFKGKFIGTVQADNGMLVWHLFEEEAK